MSNVECRITNVEVARSASAFARRVVSRMSSVHLRVNYELRITNDELPEAVGTPIFT
jgi:hypothetical protein